MSGDLTLSVPGLQPIDIALASGGAPKISAATHARAKVASQSFESVFINSMFEHMFTGIDGEGPFGGTGATKVWRSFLTDAYAKKFTEAGGLGIADHVYRSLMAQQEARP